MSKQIKVPDIGDFENVEVIEILVKQGDKVKKNDTLITIELYRKWKNKSSVEVPSTEEGTVENLSVNIGDKVSKGDLILTLKNTSQSKKKPQEITDNKIPPITEQIIKEAEKTLTLKEENQLPDKINNEYNHSNFGEVEIKEVPRVKRIAAANVVNSWKNIPHVTHHDEADITEMEEFRSTLKDSFTGKKKKITPLAFIIKALVSSLIKFPAFNSSIEDIDKGKMTIKKYYHIGIEVDTPHGLMIPKLRNVNNKNINLISKELKEISDKCRNLKIDKKEFFGGTMTVISLGGIGGSFFTPIINYPEVAILGVGRYSSKNIYYEDKYQSRIILPLSLSYDHRIIDGAEAAKFCNELKENLGKNFAYKLAV